MTRGSCQDLGSLNSFLGILCYRKSETGIVAPAEPTMRQWAYECEDHGVAVSALLESMLRIKRFFGYQKTDEQLLWKGAKGEPT